MLSYQHKYHVGNHGDVLKHLAWVSVIRYLNLKNKPYCLFDTHAGEGVYDLDEELNQEKQHGVLALIRETSNNEHADLRAYKELTNDFAIKNKLPGSPAIAASLMRAQDEMICLELHLQAEKRLKQFAVTSHATIQCHRRDAFEGLIGLTPPHIKRGAVLIDPPYEQREEYNHVKSSVEQLVKKWGTCQVLIWLPQLGERSKEKARAANQLTQHFLAKQADGEPIVVLQLQLKENARHEGMYGSTIIAINPYWQFKENMQTLLPSVVTSMGEEWEWSVY